MPFTIAHAAAAIPLYKRMGSYGSLSALILGSWAPDLPHYVTVGLSASQTHSLIGPLLSLPFALAAYVAFQLLLRPGLVVLLPPVVQRRLSDDALAPGFPRVPWSAVIASCAVGATTHVLWDSFTHASAVSRYGAAFGYTLISPGGYPLTVYKLLQHASGVLGLLLIGLWLRRWLMSTTPGMSAAIEVQKRWRALLWAALLGVPASLGLWRSAADAQGDTPMLWLASFAPQAAFHAGGAFVVMAVALACISLLLRARRAPHHRHLP